MTSPDFAPRPRKKPAQIRRVEVYLPETEHALEDLAWAAVTEDGILLAVSTDITVVSKAAFRAGFWVLDQAYDGAY